MNEKRIDLINKLIEESFGEGFKADLEKEISHYAYASWTITRYIFGCNKASYIGKLNKLISWPFPFSQIKIRGKFTEADGSKLIVPRKYLQNAEEYAQLYKENGLGNSVEIKVNRGISESTIITDFTNLGYPGKYPAHPLSHP